MYWQNASRAKKNFFKISNAVFELHLYKTFSCERRTNVYKHLSGVCCLKRILSWIHKDNALPGAGPMCSAVPHYHTIWWRSHLTLRGLKLPHCWQAAVEFYSSATSGNCVCISFFFFLPFQFWVNCVLRDVLWQTASPREVHFRHHSKRTGMGCEFSSSTLVLDLQILKLLGTVVAGHVQLN